MFLFFSAPPALIGPNPLPSHMAVTKIKASVLVDLSLSYQRSGTPPLMKAAALTMGGNSSSLRVAIWPRGPGQQFIVTRWQYCHRNSLLHELMSCLASVWHVAAPSGSSHLLNESLPPPTHPGTCQDRYRPPRRPTGGEGKLWMTKSCISNH